MKEGSKDRSEERLTKGAWCVLSQIVQVTVTSRLEWSHRVQVASGVGGRSASNARTYHHSLSDETASNHGQAKGISLRQRI